jgi:hypothetical protein
MSYSWTDEKTESFVVELKQRLSLKRGLWKTKKKAFTEEVKG